MDLLSNRFGIPTNIKKLKEENGENLRGLREVILYGMAVHLDTFIIRLTQSYVDSTLVYINRFLNNPLKAQPQKIWSTTSGKINCAMVVYYQLRGCMREFWQITGILEWNGNCAIPKNTILKNLSVVKKILMQNKGRSIYSNKAFRARYKRGLVFSAAKLHHDAISDASMSGIGFVNCDTGEFYSRSLTDLEKFLINDIFILEAIGTFLMFMANKHHLVNCKLNLWGDNEGLVKAYHKCGSSNRVTDALMLIMMLELAKYNIDPVGDKHAFEHSWCSTTENIPYGDALSRNDIPLFLKHFKAKHPSINPIQLTNIGPLFSPKIREAEELVETILIEHQDWLIQKKERKEKLLQQRARKQ